MMEYKGYVAQVEFDDEAEVFHGQVINTGDVITLQGTSVPELRKEFENSLEVYLGFCRKLNQEPEKPFSESSCCGFLPRFTAKPSGGKRSQQEFECLDFGMHWTPCSGGVIPCMALGFPLC